MKIMERQKDRAFKAGSDRRYKGSYTVEASLLMGILLTVMTALMITAFYLHDRTVLQAISCEMATAGSNMILEKDQQKATEERKKLVTQKRLLGSRNLSVRTEIEEGVSVAWKGSYPVPGLAGQLLAKGSLSVQTGWKSEKIQPADLIRKIRGLGKLANGGSD